MGIYIAPQFQDNRDMDEHSTVLAEVVDVKVVSQKWGSKEDAKITEVTFKTSCGHIIVQKELHSISKATMLNNLYNTITGRDIDVKVGFHTSEILNHKIKGTVYKYKGKGYIGTALIDFKKVK